MSCRDSRFSSAMVTFARDMTGLQDNQILSINHALMQEGAHTQATVESWNSAIDRAEEEYREGNLQITSGSRDPLSRLEAARSENPDAGRIYAAENLIRRATLAQDANTAYLVNTARDMGYSMGQIQTLFNTVFDEASQNSSLRADSDFLNSWNADPTNANLFQDRRTQYVYQQLENARIAAVESQPTEPIATSFYEYHNENSNVSNIQYDDVSGYTEISYRDGRPTERYCLPVDVSQELTSNSDPASYVANNLSGVSRYQYENEEQAREAGVVRRCATCGQFRSRSMHACPVAGSPEAIDADVRESVQRLMTNNSINTVVAPVVQTSGVNLVPTVTRHPTPDSSSILEVGYDVESCRLEVVMRSNPDRTYAYRMLPGEYDHFMEAESMGAYFARNIRGNEFYAYSNAEASANHQYRCASCGQFANSEHVCEVSTVEVAASIVPEVFSEDVEATLAEWDLELSSYIDDEDFIPEEFREPVQIPQPTIIPNARNTRYEQDGTYIRMQGVNRLRQEARNNERIAFSVFATNPDGTVVSGLGEIQYNGRGEGYTAIEEGSGLERERRLQCDCEVYRRNYHCTHIDGVNRSMQNLFNGVQSATPTQVENAVGNITDSLNSELSASLAASAQAEERFKKLSVSFVEEPEEFQTLYEEYRTKRQEYKEALEAGNTDVEYPVPYIRENAFGGLGTRESGRGLGIEIEFAFPREMSGAQMREAKQAIGEELYAAGLTRSEHQGGYGASHGWTRDHQERGWSYEDDGTTGGSDAYSGGEIVSPIMYDEPDTWTNLEKITNILKANGAVVSKGSGLHVHASIGDYDHRIENHNRLISAFAENEDLIYRLSSNPERGKHRGTGYCSPNNIPSTPYGEVDSMRRRNVGHHIALNMQSVSGRSSDHVEFRTFDSSLNPAVIQAQMGLALYLSEGATREGTASLNPGENRAALGYRVNANPERSNLSGAAWNESTLSVRKFLDTFVPGTGGDDKDNPRVKQIVSLFAMTRWQRRSGRLPSAF